MTKKILNILIPMAGRGSAFKNAGFAFPKPVIDIGGKTMIEVVVNNLRPKVPHRFIFICLKEQYDKYDFYNIFKRATCNNFDVVLIHGETQGAACTALTAIEHIDSDEELLIANADQYIDYPIDAFIKDARKSSKDGLIMTFHSSHPKWSYARVDKKGKVLETAEKKVMSSHATVGLYYYKKGADFVAAAQAMILKNIRHDNQFFVCPAYNELVLKGKTIHIHEVKPGIIFGMGTPEDLAAFNKWYDKKRAPKKKKK